MKKLLSLVVLIFMGLLVSAQAPQKFSYQAVVRDAGNNLIASHSVGVRISILQGSATGAAVYVETYAVTTNANGLMTLAIGDGTVVGGDFTTIDWSAGPFFLKTETDPNGGTNYTIEGTQQLLSVPYALYAANSANSFSGDYNDLTNQPQIPEIPENVSVFTNDAGYITMDSIPEIPTVPTSVSAFTNDAGYLTSVDCGNIDFCDLVATIEALQEQLEGLQDLVDSLIGHNEEDVPQDAPSCPGTPTVTDIDGNVYNTVWIGQQCWMKENLRTTRYADNTEILAGDTYSYTEPYRYAPNNDEANVSTYGYLYNWSAVMHGAASSTENPSGVQGICPEGWHVPSDSEWTQLTDYVSSQSQYVCGSDNTHIAKALAATTGWYEDEFSAGIGCAVGNDQSTNNATGFSALPASDYYGSDDDDFGNSARFWSATEHDNYIEIAYSPQLYYYYAGVGRGLSYKEDGLSVRCLRDESGGGGGSTTSIPTINTEMVFNIGTTSATCGGNVTNDGGATVTARGVCWSTSLNPTIADSHTTDSTGTGTFTSSITGLTPNTTYYVRAYATNSVGTAYGEQRSFTTISSSSFTCGTSTLTDIDGNTYNTVQIGEQCWMRENLRVTKYADNTEITERYAPNNDEVNVPTYGYLYSWNATMHGASSSNANPSNVQGVCPTGWHVPSDDEWTQLESFVSGMSAYWCGGSSDNIAKALAATTRWYSNNGECVVGNDQSNNNATGFSALPAGARCYGDYLYFGNGAYFWSATEGDSYDTYYRYLYYFFAYVSRDYFNKYGGCFSVRCLRDEVSSQTAPSVITLSVTSIDTTSAACGGNVISDGGATVTARGVCWSTSHNPTIAGSHTTDGTGTGTFTSNITGLTPNTTYYVRAYATSSVGTGYGSEVSFTTTSGSTSLDGQPCPESSTVTDIDGNTYNTVWIGQQCWMKENLRTMHYADNTFIPAGDTHSSTDPYRYAPNNDEANVSTYGYLYNWSAVMHGASSSNANPSGVQGICPNGWHVPSDEEWTQLENYVSSVSAYWCGGSSGSIAKALAATTRWQSQNDECVVGNDQSNNNATGFSALPAGFNGSYLGFGYYAYFWSATNSEYGSSGSYNRYLYSNYAGVLRDYNPNNESYSVRCLRD